ncbi:hypothetical protein [Metaclostridioides mangenotii]|uniref:hypothetical protein n=1 Tax=Metaclostridioides mangenotii TaxID=1540 RepID=UPI00163B004D|nr:hypothetical protein [Clostridioides mangenotii]
MHQPLRRIDYPFVCNIKDKIYFFQVVDNEGTGSQILTLINKLDFYAFGLNVDGTTYTIEERLEPNF